MGKRREADMKKLDALEAELVEYAKKHGGETTQKVSMAKKCKLDMISIARERGCSIDVVIAELRPGFEKVITNPQCGNPVTVLPDKMPTLH